MAMANAIARTRTSRGLHDVRGAAAALDVHREDTAEAAGCGGLSGWHHDAHPPRCAIGTTQPKSVKNRVRLPPPLRPPALAPHSTSTRNGPATSAGEIPAHGKQSNRSGDSTHAHTVKPTRGNTTAEPG